jgi:hypothetical protein
MVRRVEHFDGAGQHRARVAHLVEVLVLGGDEDDAVTSLQPRQVAEEVALARAADVAAQDAVP